MGNAKYCNGYQTDGWAYQFNAYCKNDEWMVPFWWQKMLQDTLFQNDLRCRWLALRNTTLSANRLINMIDSISSTLQEAQHRNFERWKIMGAYVWPNKYVFDTYDEEIKFLKHWLMERLRWLDDNIPGVCNNEIKN